MNFVSVLFWNSPKRVKSTCITLFEFTITAAQAEVTTTAAATESTTTTKTTTTAKKSTTTTKKASSTDSPKTGVAGTAIPVAMLALAGAAAVTFRKKND